jgi:hypothetical protein
MLVIGNGSSRKDIPIDKIYQEKIGCNAIFRDHYVQHLVCCDKRMVKQAIPHHKSIYTRQRWNKELGVLALPDLIEEGTQRIDEPFHWGSGPYAVLLGATLDNKVNLIGFDLYSTNNKVNNIYKGTEGYSSVDSHAVDHSYWVHQIAKVFEWFPKTSFRIYNTPDWQLPKEWKLANISLDIQTNL